MTYKKTLIFGLVFLLMIASASATIYQPTNNENDIINPFNTTDLNSDGTDEWFYAYINGSSPGNLNYTNDTDFSMSDGSCVFNTKSGGSSCSTEPDGLVSYYSLDESSGDAIDYISGNDGTPNGGVTQGVTGQVNGAYSFDGSNDYINIGNLQNDIFTWSVWFNTDTYTTGQRLIARWIGPNHGDAILDFDENNYPRFLLVIG